MLFLPGHHFSSANIGSHAGSCIGFCLKMSSTFFGTYFVSSTRRNIYSLNHSSVIARCSSPTVFHHPFLRFSVRVQIYCHQCHGMCRHAGKRLDTFFLIHSESRAHQRTKIIIVYIQQPTLAHSRNTSVCCPSMTQWPFP